MSPPQIFDDSSEQARIADEKIAGKTELVGYLFVNEPEKIIGACRDSFDELMYLVTYKSTETEVYTPTWCQDWLVQSCGYGLLIDDYLRMIIY